MFSVFHYFELQGFVEVVDSSSSSAAQVTVVGAAE